MFNKLSDVAFVGGDYVVGPVRAVVLTFHGLGCTWERHLPDPDELELAAHGALCVFPYYGPWSWMNANSRRLVDEIVERAYAEYSLSADVPLIIRGGSMGGHAALNYARYSRRPPAAVACNYPVTDPEFHATERSDLPRTFLLAYGMDGRPIEEVFNENSPLKQAAAMPRIPYLIVHGTQDTAVSKAAHSDVFVKRMRELGHQVEYIEVEGMPHGCVTDFAAYRRYQDFVLGFIGRE